MSLKTDLLSSHTSMYQELLNKDHSVTVHQKKDTNTSYFDV